MSSFGGCTACGAAAGAAARREDLNVVVKRRAWAALARGLVVPVVLAERLDWYLRVVVAAAAPGEEAAPVPKLARGWARAREVEGGHETKVVRRPRRRGQLLLAVDDA